MTGAMGCGQIAGSETEVGPDRQLLHGAARDQVDAVVLLGDVGERNPIRIIKSGKSLKQLGC
jgi:hypothetical protein